MEQMPQEDEWAQEDEWVEDDPDDQVGITNDNQTSDIFILDSSILLLYCDGKVSKYLPIFKPKLPKIQGVDGFHRFQFFSSKSDRILSNRNISLYVMDYYRVPVQQWHSMTLQPARPWHIPSCRFCPFHSFYYQPILNLFYYTVPFLGQLRNRSQV